LPQGRCCEHLLFDNLKDYKKEGKECFIVSNGIFDTTKGNLMQAGFISKDFPLPIEATNPDLDFHHNEFKGDMDLAGLRAFLVEKSGKDGVYMIILTITNNMYGGQPVSMKNIKETRKLCDEFGVPLWIDGCRMNENAYFIQKYEEGYAGKDVRDIIKEMFSLCDGFHVSMKKMLCSMGGVMQIGEGMMARFPGLNKTLKYRQIGNYSNDSQGGLSGRDLAACALALYEASS
jgi:tryptophanase